MKKKLLAVAALGVALTLSLTACGEKPAGGDPATSPSAPLPQVTASRENGVISAADWSEAHPEIYASYLQNNDNTYRVSHIEEYPDIVTLYEGMAFNSYYDSAVGHTYTLEDVDATGRPHKLANCLSCKTPDYTALVQELGVDAYSMPYEEGRALVSENVSCYNCHGNDVTRLEVTHGYLADAMKTEDVPPETLSCAQCHVEYYFATDTKETTLPYDSLAAMAPDEILAYYNEMGFTDYTNPRTGTEQIKVQHPEFETFMGEGSVHAGTMTCADCHMGSETAADGTTYSNHYWRSPLENEKLMAESCSACHKDLAAEVKAIQEHSEERVYAISAKLADLTEKLAAAVADGSKTEAELTQIRQLNRDAQFYWDFVFVENSEGAHNSKLTEDCLDKAEALCDQALAKF